MELLSLVRDLPKPAGLAGLAVLAAVVAACAPALLVAGVLVGAWWWLGWPATQMRNYALAVLAVGAVTIPFFGWNGLFVDWWAGVRNLAAGNWLTGGSQVIGLELAVGFLLAWVWWSVWTGRHREGFTQLAGEHHREQMQKNRERSAAWKSRHIYTPLSAVVKGEPSVVLGHLTGTERAKADSRGSRLVRQHPYWLTVPLSVLNTHAAVVGSTGSGKSELFRRLSVGWSEAVWQGYPVDSPARPLTILVDCKGSSDAEDDSFTWCDAHIQMGLAPDRVMSWPLEGRLDMWQMSGRQMVETIHALAKTHQHFYDIMQRNLLRLVCEAPRGVPRSSAEFLARCNDAALRDLWKGHPQELREIDNLAAAGPGRSSTIPTDALIFADLFRSVGFSFDAGRALADLDALYCTVPGTSSPVEAKAKAGVLVQLLLDELDRAKKADGHGRRVLFCIDEYSAVKSVDVTNVVQRTRSLGASLVVGSQSYEGLAPDENTRRELLDSAAGGLFVMRSQAPEALCERFGTRVRNVRDGDRVRQEETFVLHPRHVRGMKPGHVAYGLGNEVHLGHVAMLRGRQKTVVGQPSIIVGRHPMVELKTDGERIPLPELTAGQDLELARLNRERPDR